MIGARGKSTKDFLPKGFSSLSNGRSAALALMIIGGLFLFSALLGFMSPFFWRSRLFLLLVGGIAFIALSYLLLRNLALGLYILVLFPFFVKYEISTGTQTKLNIAFLFTGYLLALWLLQKLVQRDLKLKPTLINLPALLLAGVFSISLLVGQVPWGTGVSGMASIPVQVTQVLIVVFSVGLMLMTGDILDPSQLRKVVLVFLGFSGLVILNAFLGRTGLPYYFIYTVGMFPSWVIVLSMGLLCFDGQLHRFVKIYLVILIAAWMTFTMTDIASLASSWLPPLAAFGVMLFLRSKKLFVVVLLAAGISFFIWPDVLLTPILQGTGGGALYRIALWQRTLAILKFNPLLGYGPANYASYNDYFSMIGALFYQSLPTWLWDAPSHNQFLDILAQTGVLGLGMFFWLLAALFATSWRLYRATLSFSQGYGLAILGALVAIVVIGMLGDWILPYVYNIGVAGFRQSVLTWIFLGGLLVFHNG